MNCTTNNVTDRATSVDEAALYDRLLDYQNVLFLGHRNADPDAISSTFALAEVFGGTVGVVDRCNRVAAIMVEELDIDAVYTPDPADYDFTVVVDTSTRSQLNNIMLGDYGVIDHHSVSQLLDDASFYLHKNTDSNAEIIVDIMRCMGAPIMERTAIALMIGIVTDTGHFKHASAGSFQAIAYLIEQSGVSYSEAMDLLAGTPQELSMRLAVLEAANRAEIRTVDDWVVAASEAESFGASAATSLTGIGADVSFVGTAQDDVLKVSGRANRDAVRCGINLGVLLRDIGIEHNGSGGGHAGAAGMEVSGDAEVVLAGCVEESMRILKGTSRDYPVRDGRTREPLQ
jgi:nanoRNase/pAp phosphatase (c-di-AMP/oligoRNAs hydrolase)